MCVQVEVKTTNPLFRESTLSYLWWAPGVDLAPRIYIKGSHQALEGRSSPSSAFSILRGAIRPKSVLLGLM